MKKANKKDISQRVGVYASTVSNYLNKTAIVSKDTAKKRYAKAKFPYLKTIEDFDFNYRPSIDKRVINDLPTCKFMGEKRNAVFIVNPGTGKTHISIGVGIKASIREYKALFTQVHEMLHKLYFSWSF